MLIETAVKDLKQGDLVDLEGDIHADPAHDNSLLFGFFQEVDTLEPESAGCICVHFVDSCFVFPAAHSVRVQRD